MAKIITKTPCLGGIYRITCTVEGKEKSYIGSTKQTFNRRWNGHRRDLRSLRHSNRHLQSAWNKYGKDAFEFHPLEPVAFEEDLIEAEQKWIDFYQAPNREYGYNINPTAGRTCHSQETRDKLRDANLGRKQTPESIAKTRAANLGRKCTPEARANIRAANLGRCLGRKRSPESRANMSAACLGRKRSPESIAKTIAANLGRKRTPEQAARMRSGRVKNQGFYYRAISPNGMIYDHILSLREFCCKHELTNSCMCNLANGKRQAKNHKGWTCEKIAK